MTQDNMHLIIIVRILAAPLLEAPSVWSRPCNMADVYWTIRVQGSVLLPLQQSVHTPHLHIGVAERRVVKCFDEQQQA